MTRDNYSYKKYQKELAKKKKREEKQQRKRAASVSAEHPALSDGRYSASAEPSERASNEDVTVV